MTNQLQLRFVGNEISPIGIRAHELADVIKSFESAVAALVVQEHSSLQPENVPVSLVQIEGGSVGLTFDSDLADYVYSAGLRLGVAIEGRRWGELPFRTLDDLRKLVGFTKRRSCTAELRTTYNSSTAVAVISPDTEIPDTATLYGVTELVGDVKRVGGAEPKVMFTTLQGETLYCSVDEELAKELGQYLYERVQLAGYARWNFETLKVVEFEIKEVVAHIQGSPKVGFSRLRERFGHHFDGIDDVDEWVNEIRHGG